jgi:hypothetical protein
VQSLLTPRLSVSLAVVVSLLLPLQVCQPGKGLRMLLTVAGPLLLPLQVCEPGTSLGVLLAVAVLGSWTILRFNPLAEPSISTVRSF